MAELRSSLRRSLAERGVMSRAYAAEDNAALLSKPRVGAYALLDEIDHLRLRAVRPGFDPETALASALAEAASLGGVFPFAYQRGLGWVCSRISDCGLGVSLSAIVHVPAISASGLRDLLLRALLADGAAVRGFYSTGEDSSGCLYEVSIEPSACGSIPNLLASFSSAVTKVVQGERKARGELSKKADIVLADQEARSFGAARYARLLDQDEAAGFLATLRLAALRGSLSGVVPRSLSRLLLALGPACVASAGGVASLPEGRQVDSLRAGIVKAALAEADYNKAEEGA